MDVTCQTCGAVSQLASSNDDRANWEPILEQRAGMVPSLAGFDEAGVPIVQQVSGVVSVVVARRLVWKCPQKVEDNESTCDATNVIEEPAGEDD